MDTVRVSRVISSSSSLISDSDVPWVLQSSEQGLGLMDQNLRVGSFPRGLKSEMFRIYNKHTAMCNLHLDILHKKQSVMSNIWV